MYRLALQMTRNEADADDVLQSALLRALKYFPRFLEKSPDPERNVRFWLLKITRNAFFDSLSTKDDWEILDKAENEVTADLEESEPPVLIGESVGLHLSDAEADFFRRASNDETKRALDTLNPLQRSILFLTIEKYATHEIAEILNVALGTVLSARARALDKMRRALGDLRPH